MLNIKDISTKIGLPSSYLKLLFLYHNKYYKTYYIKKTSGKKERLIASPNYEIKAIQSWILRNYLEKIVVNDRATGFVHGRSIKLNANFHLGQKFLLCLDIRNFFPSISKDKIYTVLKDELKEDFLATFISELCTFNSTLPQGGVTSPALSNIIFKPQDEKITKLCNETNVNYSRYADDLCFSSNYFKNLIDLVPKIREILNKSGFALNDDKTRFMSGKHKIVVTGLYLNSGRITVGRERKRIVRAALHSYYVKKDSNINLNEIYGMISFISGIEKDYKKKISNYIEVLKLKEKIV